MAGDINWTPKGLNVQWKQGRVNAQYLFVPGSNWPTQKFTEKSDATIIKSTGEQAHTITIKLEVIIWVYFFTVDYNCRLIFGNNSKILLSLGLDKA